MQSHHVTKSFSGATKFLMVLGTVVVFGLAYVAYTALGGTVLNTTLTVNPNLENGLVGHWTLDGEDVDLSASTAEILDRSGQGNDGNWRNHASTVVPGRIGQGIEFDGVDDFIDVGDVGGGLKSVAFWMKTSSTTQDIMKFSGGGSSWYNASFGYCRRMTMTAGGESGGVATTTTNGFALLATSTIADLAATSSAGKVEKLDTTNAYPLDVVFTSGTDCNADGGSLVDFYFEEYASTTGQFVAWIEATDVSSTTEKTVLMYYGNPSATDQSNETGVFGALGEEAVWNLSEDPSGTAPQMKDSTAAGLDGTSGGSMTAADQVAGQADGALEFDGTGDHVTMGNVLDKTGAASFSLAAWVKHAGGNTDESIIAKQLNSGDFTGYNLNIDSANDYLQLDIAQDFSPSNNIRVTGNTDIVAGGLFHYVVATYDGSKSGSGVNLYVDGVRESSSIDSDTLTGSASNAANFNVGSRSDGGGSQFNGVIDQAAVYGSELHAMDVLTMYNNTSDSAAFWTFGGEETQGDSPLTILLDSGSASTTGITSPVIYVDGVEDSTVDAAWRHVTVVVDAGFSAPIMAIGKADDGNFDGVLDDVRIYNRTLTANEVKRLYGLGATTRVNTTLATNPDLENGLVAHWSFDGEDVDTSSSTREILDRSGQGYHGDWLNHATTTATGRIGQAIELDGVDDTVNAGHVSELLSATQVTLAGWFLDRSPNSGTVRRLLSETNTADFRHDVSIGTVNGDLYWEVGNAENSYGQWTTYAENVPANTWYHGVFVFDGNGSGNSGRLKMYINGVERTLAFTGTIPTQTSASLSGIPFFIGSLDGTQEFFDGLADDVRVYDRALSAAEIQRLYELGATTRINATLAENPDLAGNLVSHWSFDGKDLTSNVTDRSGQENHGTLAGSTTTQPGRIGQGLEFNGSSTLITVGGGFGNLGEVSVSLWMYPYTQGDINNGQLLSTASACGSGRTAQEGWSYGFSADFGARGELCFEADFEAGNLYVRTAQDSFTLDEWQHVVLTWTGTSTASSVKIYRNGSEVSYNSQTSGAGSRVADNSSIATVGRQNSTAGTYFDGILDDVRVYDRVLSDAEIRRLYELYR